MPPELLPQIETAGGDPVVFEITKPTEIAYGEYVIDVSTRVLALNALLLERDKWATSGRLRDYGSDLHRTVFNRHILWVRDELSAATGQELLFMDGYGQSMKYRLSERIQLVDKRKMTAEDDTLASLAAEITPSSDASQGVEGLHFKDNSVRRRIVASAIRSAIKLPGAYSRMTNVLGENWQQVTAYLNPASERLSSEDCHAFFEKIEKGLVAALQEEQTPETEAARIDMLEAYLSMYYKHLFIVDILARQLMKSRERYDDLFQEGCIALTKALMSYTRENSSGEDGTFGSSAYTWIKGSMLYYLYNKEGLIRLPKHVAERRRQIRRALDEYIQDHGSYPTVENIAEIVSLTPSQVREAIVDTYGSQTIENIDLADNSFDPELNRTLIHEEIHDLLRDDGLTTREKIVLSMRFGIFVPSLGGACFAAKGKVTFEYPYSPEGMPPERQGNYTISLAELAKLLGLTSTAINGIERKGLRKARSILLDRGVEPDMF